MRIQISVLYSTGLTVSLTDDALLTSRARSLGTGNATASSFEFFGQLVPHFLPEYYHTLRNKRTACCCDLMCYCRRRAYLPTDIFGLIHSLVLFLVKMNNFFTVYHLVWIYLIICTSNCRKSKWHLVIVRCRIHPNYWEVIVILEKKSDSERRRLCYIYKLNFSH